MLRIAVVSTRDAFAQKIINSLAQVPVSFMRFAALFDCAVSHATQSFDLIVMDYSNHPLDDGTCSDLGLDLPKQTATMAIVSDAHIENAVKLLNAGVDRCLPLSFDEKHFRAIVRALTRRRQGLTSSVSAYGPLSFDHDAKIATLHGEALALTPRESQVLEIMLRRVGQITSKENFLEEMGLDANDVNSSAVEVYVHRVRKKISGDVLPIRNIKRCGYFLGRFTPTPAPAETEIVRPQRAQLGLGMSV